MKLRQLPAPHIRYHENNRTLMLDVILLLCVLAALAALFYGARALMLCVVTVGAAVLADTACVLLRGRAPNVRDLSPVVTGLIIALCMPATVSYYVVVAAALFAILVAKHPFGGTGHNVFNPAAAGFSFAAICWPQQVFYYPMPYEKLGLWGTFVEKQMAFVFSNGELGETAVKLYQNPAFVLKLGGVPTNYIADMALGEYPGPMGATNLLVLVACLLYLLFRRTVRWQLPVSFLGVCMLMAFCFVRSGSDSVLSMFYELSAGALLFGAVFMVSDPVTSPKRGSSMLIYGVFAGLVTMLFRYFGGFEESVSFAILCANAFVPVIDRHSERLHRLIRRRRFELQKTEAPL